MMGQTNPLQLIKDPIVLASRQLKPVYLAANVHPPNLPMNARMQIAIVNAHIVPNERIEFLSASHPWTLYRGPYRCLASQDRSRGQRV